jgi:hypothetical protein
MQQEEDKAVKTRERHREIFDSITVKVNGKNSPILRGLNIKHFQ